MCVFVSPDLSAGRAAWRRQRAAGAWRGAAGRSRLVTAGGERGEAAVVLCRPAQPSCSWSVVLPGGFSCIVVAWEGRLTSGNAQQGRCGLFCDLLRFVHLPSLPERPNSDSS